MALPAFMKKAFSRDGGKSDNPKKSDAADRLANLAAKRGGSADMDFTGKGKGSSGGKGKKMPPRFGKKKPGAMQAAALRME